MSRRLTKADFKVPALLLALSVVPMLGGLARLSNLFEDGAATPESARFVEAPVPVLIHVVCATLYCLLGAFQFSAAFRLRFRAWHRQAGKVVLLCGLLAAATGLWMTAFYAIPTSMQGPHGRSVSHQPSRSRARHAWPFWLGRDADCAILQ